MKTKNNPYKKCLVTVLICLVLSSTSCTEYLDKAPESSITDREVFGNFTSFNGWVEEMYYCMANYHQRLAGNWFFTFNMTDMMQNTPILWDDGDYWDQRFLYGEIWATSGQDDVMSKFVWQLAWYAIRKANIGLQNLELMEGTQEEKDLIKGQCLYFRAFYHLELIQFWGGLPYVDRVISADEVIRIPRLTYIETAKKIAEDFQAAAELLPLTWTQTQTAVANETAEIRITKIHALAYLGKNLLYAASPMMNEVSTGKNEYDAELCRQAADALHEVIHLSKNDPNCPFILETWNNWPEIFAMKAVNRHDRSGHREVIQNQQIYQPEYYRWTTSRAASPVQADMDNDKVETPTHNYVKYYHMAANGLPVEDPLSGYDANDPWRGREPRFYNDIIYDGVQIIEHVDEANAKAVANKYARLHNEGLHRHGTTAASGVNGSVTGYLYRKFLPFGSSKFDGAEFHYSIYHPRMRMADVWLMYAEAMYYGHGSATARAGFPTADYTAQEAVETIRARAQLPPLPDKYYAGGNVPLYNFQETIIRERAVELAFEGLRWFDLRRWNIAHETKYKEKWGVNFDVVNDAEMDEQEKGNVKPGGAKRQWQNFQEVLLYTRTFEKKHRWIPFQPKFVNLYEEFNQNPGW
ncbi:MAG: RagB/SusD family nutrient uptake outer membrane protein [Bacteroidales bacterium]|nr:RagB/SusD family nutrient uptake outer membrane protein [Bacteroidales bacterium]